MGELENDDDGRTVEIPAADLLKLRAAFDRYNRPGDFSRIVQATHLRTLADSIYKVTDPAKPAEAPG